MSMNKIWAISSWISFLTSVDIWIHTETSIADTRNLIANRREPKGGCNFGFRTCECLSRWVIEWILLDDLGALEQVSSQIKRAGWEARAPHRQDAYVPYYCWRLYFFNNSRRRSCGRA